MTDAGPAAAATVIGAGAWGTALALVVARGGTRVGLWCRRADQAAAINDTRENADRLPGIALPDRIAATTVPVDACTLAGPVPAFAILAVPSPHLTAVAARFATALPADCPIIVATKGLDPVTGRPLPARVSALLPGRPVALLSGPSFAAEVARDLPTAVTLAGPPGSNALLQRLIACLHRPTFRVYASDDPIGVALGGTIKNVIAIACGIAAGRGLGDNARAALITRGLAETTRLAVALGGRPDTLMGLSGLGDLALTCSSPQSRNFSLGLALGRGTTLADHLAATRTATEGVDAAAVVTRLADSHRIDLPICAAVHAILKGDCAVGDGIRRLLDRPPGVDRPITS